MNRTNYTPTAEALALNEYFAPIIPNLDRSFVEIAELIERSAKIEEHPFFAAAKESRGLLKFWSSQEAVVTNPFSQILFRVMSSIKNVHIRSILLPVVDGEHSYVRHGIADKSHPWLIWRLCQSLSLSAADIKPSKAVTEFICELESTVGQPMRALGALGIGNEQMLLAEYQAIEACFDAVYPEADYRGFLQANIGEDETHTKLIGIAAVALTSFGYAPEEFIEGARQGVMARVRYYDSLLEESRTFRD